MESAGGRLAGEIVVRAVEGQLSVATFLGFVSRLGATVWTLWSPLHRRVMPGALRDAAELLES
jgi:hypothetical protein